MTRFSSLRGVRGAVCAAAALWLVYVLAVLTAPGQWLDDELFGLAQRLGIGPLGEWLPVVGRWLLPRVMAVALIVVGLVALVRRRYARVAQGVCIPVVSVPTSWYLRESLPRPDHGYSYVENTLPSTHVTVVVAAVVAIAVLAPLRPVWLDRVLVGLVLLACLGNVVGHAHRPSDVVASVLLVMAVGGGVQAVTRVRGSALPRRDTLTTSDGQGAPHSSGSARGRRLRRGGS